MPARHTSTTGLKTLVEGIENPTTATLIVECPATLQRKVADIMEGLYADLRRRLTPDELKEVIIKADWTW